MIKNKPAVSSKSVKSAAVGAVIFDVDGILIDSVDLHTKAWQLDLGYFGHTVSFRRVRNQIGKGGQTVIQQCDTHEIRVLEGEE